MPEAPALIAASRLRVARNTWLAGIIVCTVATVVSVVAIWLPCAVIAEPCEAIMVPCDVIAVPCAAVFVFSVVICCVCSLRFVAADLIVAASRSVTGFGKVVILNHPLPSYGSAGWYIRFAFDVLDLAELQPRHLSLRRRRRIQSPPGDPPGDLQAPLPPMPNRKSTP